ncbi:MAG TPA: DUF1801 domain-containing protein [Bacteroidia bacterium]|nr:DUF1801 domain-containing protein [Bacteroidia bacterium]
MAKEKPLVSDPTGVTAHIKKLDPAAGKIIEAIRKIVLSTDKQIGEHIKWNSPAFFYSGEMKPFDPKEYKRDLAVINLHRGAILVVFPTGAKIKDNSGFLGEPYKDGRRIAAIPDLAHVKTNEKILKKIIKEWLAQIE